MQPSIERSGNPEDQPGANVRSNVDSNVRMTVQEAAAALGTTVEAVRGRMHRGKYGREKTEDGRVFVILTPDQLMNGQERSEPADGDLQNIRTYSSERSCQHSDGQSAHVRGQSFERGELVEELRDQLAFLRAELEARNEELRRREEEHREEARRKDHIIMSLTQRVTELESPRDEPHVPETVSEDPGGTSVPPERETPSLRPARNWWRKFFGFE